MKTGKYKAWWQEMGAISRGMMFVQGHIATPATLETDGKPEPASLPPASARKSPAESRKRLSRGWRVNAARVLHNLEFLGGRPMHAGHNDDLDEPFPQSRDRVVARRKSRASAEAMRGGKLQPDYCATC